MLFPNHLSSSAAGNDLEMCMSSLVLTAKNVLETLTLYRTLSTYRKRFFSPLLFVFFSISAVNSSKSLSLPPTHTSRFKCWWEFWSNTGVVRDYTSQPYHENGAYPCHENLSWAAKRYFNQLYDVFTSKLNQFVIANSCYASFSKTRQLTQLAGLTIRL